MKLTDIACGLNLFSGITRKGVEHLLERLNGVKKTYRKGEIVMFAGRRAERLLAVASGHLHVYSDISAEHPILVREFGVGEVLGLWILHVSDIPCWPGTIIAAEDSELISISMEGARTLLNSNEDYVARLAVNAAKILSRELFSTWRKLMVMDAPTIESRVQVYLSELANENGDAKEVEVPINRERMAEYLGVARPSLSRALGNLRDRGLITWRKNVFHINF
ncbi:MAG: Crp/Fnr family transcriptional regulator [Kiritimatiellae bacterium]|nr:Crp/Fnr family transcriptional regulator [Kiritimatiellia bacterium]